jgi:hypothetical protein
MNKQQLADLFSEQVDHLLHGESTDIPANTEDLQELLDFIGQSTMQNQFQAGPVAQATFQSQLAGWFGLGNGGAPMTILGLSKTWFISIVIVIITLVTGTGIISIIATSIFVYNVSGLPLTPTTEPTAEPTGEPTGEPTAEPTGEPTVEPTGEPTIEPTSEPTTEPGTPPVELPTLIFLTNLASAQLCQGAYTTQETLVNYGNQPVTDAALAWNVIEGGTFVNDVNISSPGVPETSGETGDATPVSAGDSFVLDEEIVQSGYVNFNPVSVEQDVNLDVKVKVNDAWWEQPDGTEIKVKLSVTNRVVYSNNDDYEYSDYNRGHGNDPDGFDEDNPGRSRRHHSDSSTSQIITIVKQSAQWVIVTGPAHSYDDQSFLVDGTIVTIDVCSEAPPTLPPGANVQVIGLLQPDGTLVVISMSIISINNSNNIITGDFKSGVPMPGKDNDSGGDSDNDGGGGGGGGHDGDHNRGHGNDDDGHDEDNPGHGGR